MKAFAEANLRRVRIGSIQGSIQGRIDTMEQNQLKRLYVEELRDIYNAENQLIKALPRMAKAATSVKLSAGFEHHLEQTKEQIKRLDQIFSALGENPGG